MYTGDGLTKYLQKTAQISLVDKRVAKLKIWNWKDQDQSIPKLIGILTQVFCTFGPNLVTLAWTGDELSRPEAQNGVTFDFEIKFHLVGQS